MLCHAEFNLCHAELVSVSFLLHVMLNSFQHLLGPETSSGRHDLRYAKFNLCHAELVSASFLLHVMLNSFQHLLGPEINSGRH
jgi:uncharacterized protein YsxB (DUF464 family)